MVKRPPLSFDEKVEFIIRVGRALHLYGTTASKIESALKGISEKLSVQGEFNSTPTSIFVWIRTPEGAVEEEDGESYEVSRLLRLPPGEIDLERLCTVDEIGDAVIEGKIGPSLGTRAINNLHATPPRYNNLLRILSFGIISACISLFFSRTMEDLICSLIVGLVIGLFEYLSKRIPGIAGIYEALGAAVASLLAALLTIIFPGLSAPTVIISGLIVLIPGLSLTMAITELATMDLSSGTARLMWASMILLKISFGVFLGEQLISSFLPYLVAGAASKSPFELPSWSLYPALIIVSLAFTVVFRARPKDWWYVLGAAGLGQLSSRITSQALGPTLGLFIGGALVGLAGNGLSRFFKRPASLILIPGIILLVPGSFGHRGINLLFEHNILMGIQTVMDMVTFALALVSGLFCGQAFVNPRRNL